MENVLMMQGAGRLMDVCAKVKKNEKVLIVTDYQKVSIAEVIASAAHERGADVVLTVMTKRELDGAEPPFHVAAAMKSSDVIFTPLTHLITNFYSNKEAIDDDVSGIMLNTFIPDLI